MTKGTFGEHLRREREMRGVSLQEISNATRISVRFLEALENEQWERLPGGVFNRGFVRAVAHFLGLSEENLVAEYAETTNDQPEMAVWADNAPAKPKPRLGLWLTLFLLTVLGAGGWFAYQQARPLIDAWRNPLPEAPRPAAPVPPETPEKLLLRIDAVKTTDLTVVADGQTLFTGQLTAGEQKKFEATEIFEISARNATAVAIDVNGQPFLLQGGADEPGSLKVTRKDLVKPAGGSH